MTSKYLLSLAEVGYGKTRKEVKCIAEAVAKEKGTLTAGKISDGWRRKFLERNLSISLQSGDATAHAHVRMEAANVKNAFTIWTKPECHLSHFHRKILPKKEQENPISNIWSESTNYSHWLW